MKTEHTLPCKDLYYTMSFHIYCANWKWMMLVRYEWDSIFHTPHPFVMKAFKPHGPLGSHTPHPAVLCHVTSGNTLRRCSLFTQPGTFHTGFSNVKGSIDFITAWYGSVIKAVFFLTDQQQQQLHFTEIAIHELQSKNKLWNSKLFKVRTEMVLFL